MLSNSAKYKQRPVLSAGGCWLPSGCVYTDLGRLSAVVTAQKPGHPVDPWSLCAQLQEVSLMHYHPPSIAAMSSLSPSFTADPPPSSVQTSTPFLPHQPPHPHHAAIPLPCHLTAFRRPCTQKPIVCAGRRQKAPEREMEQRNQLNFVFLL